MRSALNGRVECVEVEEYIVNLVDSPAGWPWRHWKREQNLDSIGCGRQWIAEFHCNIVQ